MGLGVGFFFNFFFHSRLYICLPSPCFLASGVSEERSGDLLEASGHQLLLSHCLPVALSLFCLGFDNQVWFCLSSNWRSLGHSLLIFFPFLFSCVLTHLMLFPMCLCFSHFFFLLLVFISILHTGISEFLLFLAIGCLQMVGSLCLLSVCGFCCCYRCCFGYWA